MSNAPNQSPNELLNDELTFDLVQTAHGDWIIPALNGLHFGTNDVSPSPPGESFAQSVLKRHFSHRLHKEDCLFVIVGSDSGQLIHYVQSHQPLPRGSRWVFIEPAPIAHILPEQPEIARQLDDYVHLITPDQWPETARLLLLDDYFRIGGVVFERSLAALDHTTPVYLELAGELDAELSSRRYITTANLGKLPFIKAQLGNIPNFFAHLVPLKGIFQGKKALILAGGPSLDLEIDWIKANRDRLFLIAVSRISARLLATGIYPDLIATVDPHPISLTVSRQMFDFPPNTILVSGNHAYPGITNRWPHKILYTDNLLPWNEKQDRKTSGDDDKTPLNPIDNLTSTGPTVTHTCVMLAAYLGFTEIAFAGLDLCHSPEGQTHAKGSSEASSGPLLDYTAVKVTTNQGDTAWTTPDYFAGIDMMRILASHLAQKGVRLINPSRHGAVIPGVTFKPLDEIDWSTEPFDRTLLDEILSYSSEDRRKHLDHVSEALKQMNEDLGKIEVLAQLAIEANHAFFRMVNPARQALHQRRIRAIDRFMRHRLTEAEELVRAVAQHELIATDIPHDFFALDAKQAENLTHRFYDAIRRGAQFLRTLFPNLEYRLHTRQLELDDTTPSQEILERYEQGEETERVLWLKTSRNLAEQVVAHAEAHYERKITDMIAADRERNQARRAPKASLRLAEMYFSQHNLVALQALEHALSVHPDQTQAAPYDAYLKGLQAELGHKLVNAMSAYEDVLNHASTEHDTTLLEHCLLRIASVSLTLGNPEQANQALDMASALNPGHWPLAAKLATLRNDDTDAVEAYANYLTLFPGDHQRILMLAELFNRLRSTEGIRQCMELANYCAPAEKAKLLNELGTLLHQLNMS